jgi:poly [ADP-ribose] polymerase 10/14/15
MTKNNGNSNTKLAWHGTRATAPATLYHGEHGFNINYSGNGMWGPAIYFAVNASYSCPGYSHPIAEQPGTYQVFLAEVALGDSVELAPTNTLKEPPMKDGCKRYDSVTGYTSGSNVHMIYANIQAYPNYLVTYRLN